MLFFVLMFLKNRGVKLTFSTPISFVHVTFCFSKIYFSMV